MALPVWGEFPTFRVLEVGDQNLAESAHFPPSSGGEREREGRPGLIPSDFNLNFCGRRRHVQRRGAATATEAAHALKFTNIHLFGWKKKTQPRSQATRCWFSLGRVWVV